MSGFIAIFNTNQAPIDSNILEQLTSSLYFRGPDRQQVCTDGPTGLGHTLFRTTDEAQYENQPATLGNGVWITGCIRIDAREDLVQKLGMHGKIRLEHTPDSHLVLLAYEAWGENCPEHLLGDFSFALWDGRTQKLFCARDRFGMRQLVYTLKSDTVIVSNSIDCILQHPLVSDRLRDEAIGDFLLFGDHRWGSRARTSFADIIALEPAHCLSVMATGEKTWRYWDLESNISAVHYHNSSDYVEHFSEILEAAVSDRIRCKNVFISLSGGMDSSSLAATVQHLSREGKKPIRLHTGTVLYDSIHPSDERQFVKAVSDSLNLTTHFIDAGNYPFLSPPVLTTTPIELYQPQLWLDLDRYAVSESRVVLNGEGGDEALAFSSARETLKDVNPLRILQIMFRLKRRYGSFPPLGTGWKKVARTFFGRAPGPTARYPYPGWINQELEEELDLKQRWLDYWSAVTPDIPRRNPRIYQSIMAPDWNSDDTYMSCGFTLPEQRSPFLDPRVINFVISLPALPWLFNKHILRSAMSGKLPETVLQRPKTLLGFLNDTMIRNMEHRRLNEWESAEGLSAYIDRSKLPVLNHASGEKLQSYVNLRPLILNHWLSGLQNRADVQTQNKPLTHL